MSKLDKFFSSKLGSVVLPLAATILLFIAWELIVNILGIKPFTLPAPSVIIASSISKRVFIK